MGYSESRGDILSRAHNNPVLFGEARPEHILRPTPQDINSILRILKAPFVSHIAGCEKSAGKAELRDLVRGTARLYNRVIAEKPDALMFVDTSARPLAHLFRKFYQLMLPTDKVPKTLFMSIHKYSGPREPSTWKNFTYFNADERKEEWKTAIEQLRQTHGKYLPDDASLLVVDDISAEGGTLSKIREVITSAFPKVHMQTHLFLRNEPHWKHDSGGAGVMQSPIEYYNFRNNLESNVKQNSFLSGSLARPLDAFIQTNKEKIEHSVNIQGQIFSQRQSAEFMQRESNVLRSEMNQVATAMAQILK